MTEEKQKIKDADMEKVGVALQRSAARAREIVSRTGTPLIIYKNGQILKEIAEKKGK